MQKDLWFERHLWLILTGYVVLTGACYAALLAM